MSAALNQHLDETDKASIIVVVYQPFPAFGVVLCRISAGLTVQINQRGGKCWIGMGFKVLQDVAFWVDNRLIKLVSSIRDGLVIWLLTCAYTLVMCALKWLIFSPIQKLSRANTSESHPCQQNVRAHRCQGIYDVAWYTCRSASRLRRLALWCSHVFLFYPSLLHDCCL